MDYPDKCVWCAVGKEDGAWETDVVVGVCMQAQVQVQVRVQVSRA